MVCYAPVDDCLEAARRGGGETPVSPGIDVEIPLPKVATSCFQIVVVANSIVVARIWWDFLQLTKSRSRTAWGLR